MEQYLGLGLGPFMLVFFRVGAAFMVMPGFGENYVPVRARLIIALALALVLVPSLAPKLPAMPDNPVLLLPLAVSESLIGFLIGGSARLIVTSLHVAGVVIAFQSSLAYAQTVDPNQGTQSTLVAALLNLLGVVLIFALGLHALMIEAVFHSYTLFPPGAAPPVDTFSEMAVTLVTGSFTVGLQMAAPFIMYGLLFYIGLGMLQRLMPQLQLFFIAMPAQLLLAFFMLGTVISIGMIWFIEHFERRMGALAGLE